MWNLKKIAFLDIEVNPNNISSHTKGIESLGLLMNEVSLQTTSISKIKDEFLRHRPQFICGHNFIKHDKIFLEQTSFCEVFDSVEIIDTLFLSMLLYPTRRFHKLEKPYKNEIDIENQPLEDANLTQALFLYLDTRFDAMQGELRDIFVELLFDEPYFKGYFIYKGLYRQNIDVYAKISKAIVCSKEQFNAILANHRIELALVISFIYHSNNAGFSFVILNHFPHIAQICQTLLFSLESIALEAFASDEFGVKSFREFDIADNGSLLPQISQKDIVLSALNGESLLAILPTGGGKTFTFQLPALIKAKTCKTLSVVISPLQALIKNQVDGFKNINNNFCVRAISGYLNPIERSSILTQVRDGFVDILYIAPEALRSNAIFNALKRRIIERFIIDEAHCFSSWGHDFRHDYHFIATTIKELESSPYQPKIAVSCFTATAKRAVIDDLKAYFKENLNVALNEFVASSERYNLKYEVISVKDDKQKYTELLKILQKRSFDEFGTKTQNPTIIYIPQNANECRQLSQRLRDEPILQGLEIEAFYAKLDDDKIQGKRGANTRGKSQILQDFIDDKIDIIIATTAFGMGIDKANITTIIHYQQSDSLESYLQESGRGARNAQLEAKCIVLYNKNEFDAKFTYLNHSKIEYSEIQSIAKVLQNQFKKTKRDSIKITRRDIARKIGIDVEDSSNDWEIIIDTAILELERHKIIKRGRNNTAIFATSYLKQDNETQMETIRKILESDKKSLEKYIHKQKEINMYSCIIRVMQNIIQKSKHNTAIEIEELADIVGIDKNDIFIVLYECQKYQLVDFLNDISVFIENNIKNDMKAFFALENKLLDLLDSKTSNIDLCQKIDTHFKQKGKNTAQISKQILQSWAWLSILYKTKFHIYFRNNICYFEVDSIESMRNLIQKRQKICLFAINQILANFKGNISKENIEIEFSTAKLKMEFDKFNDDKKQILLDEIHHCLVFYTICLQALSYIRGD